MPLNFILILLGSGGLLFCLGARKTGRIIVRTGIIMFIVAGLLPVAPYMLAHLETAYQRPSVMPARVDGIIVLGGTFYTALPDIPGEPAIGESIERIISGIGLARQYPNAVIVFSGGTGSLIQNGHSEAQDTKDFLEQIGFNDGQAFYEDKSRNTYENALFSKDLLLPQPGETWILVTSAYHMKRAMAVFETLEWPDLIPYPTDFQTSGGFSLKTMRFDVGHNFYALTMVLHEYAGFAGYKITGKIIAK